MKKKIVLTLLATMATMVMMTGCSSKEEKVNAVPTINTEVAEKTTEVASEVAENAGVPEVHDAAEVSTEAPSVTTDVSTEENTTEASVEVSVETPAPAETTMWSTTSVNVRAEASKDSNKLGTLAQGDTVVVLGDTASEWVTVSYNGGTGYVKGSFLSSTEVAKAAPVKKAAKKTAQTAKTNNADTAQTEQPQQAASAPAQTEQPQQAAPAQESAPAATSAPVPAIESQPAQSEQQPSNVDLNPDVDTSGGPEYHDNPGAGVNSGLPY